MDEVRDEKRFICPATDTLGVRPLVRGSHQRRILYLSIPGARRRHQPSLSYQFCGAYQGGDPQAPSPNPAGNPPYAEVPYAAPYNGAQPLGNGVTINPVTGIISGIAPDLIGQYVICVCVNEYRNGVLIATTRKELHLSVNDCNPLRAQLNPRPAFCQSLDVSFSNDAAGNPPNADYLWNFGDPASGANNTSTQAITNHTFSTPGDYTVKLRVTLQGVCSDSTTTLVKIWPGFFPGFTISGVCVLNPFQFTDTTRANYGVVDNWRWNFGDNATLADTSRIRTPAWTYGAPGNVNVTLIVSTSKGCTDTVTQVLNVLDKPLINMGFRDTLICQYDTLPLRASGSGNFSWTPLVNIANPNTPTPNVFPMNTTWYYVNLENNGCVNRDSVRVRVTPGVLIIPMSDTTICFNTPAFIRGSSNGQRFVWQPLQLNASGGLYYNWSPATGLSSTTIANPIALYRSPAAQIRYRMIASDSMRCPDTAYLSVRVFQTAPSVFVPTGFTPNADGLNDVIKPILAGKKN